MFSPFKEIVENRHDHAKKLKETKNRKLIGYLCSYVPEEIIYAAGGIPIRILTNEEPPALADTYMQAYYCTFSRSILHQGLSGDLSYLDGLVTAYTCVTMRLAFDNLKRSAGFPYTRFIYMPGIIDSQDAKNFYYKELKRFVNELESLFDTQITDDDLREAIQIYDENRSLIMKIFEGRKNDRPVISGKEAYLLTLSGMLTDKQDHNKLLKGLLEKLPDRQPHKEGVSRVMLVGSPMDNVKLLELIEDDIGAWVVTDDTCTGTRYTWGETPSTYLDQDPLRAIVERYMVSRPPCPTKNSPNRWVQCMTCPFRDVSCFELAPSPRGSLSKTLPFPKPERICRFRHMLQLGISHKVEGVIAVLQKFCDPHGFDYHHVVQAFQDVGIPSLFLEIENIFSTGQTKTRVQAFIEMLQPVDYMIEPEIRDVLNI